MKHPYACGKCGSTALYRDDDYMIGQAYICCKICGNRWPGGFEPKVVKPIDRGTPEPKKAVFDPESTRISASTQGGSSTIAATAGSILQIEPDLNELLTKQEAIVEDQAEQKKIKFIKKCVDCGKEKPHHGRGLCGACYSKHRVAGTLPPRLNHHAPSRDGNPANQSNPSNPVGPHVYFQPARAGFQDGSTGSPCTGFEAAEYMEGIECITLAFSGDDIALFGAILNLAKKNRRDPDKQILWILEHSEELRELGVGIPEDAPLAAIGSGL